jgi:hypothetical protein|tara:strand:- start:168 stop:416 length:249 start_codon:yes stop_codon:yes gene_type:complete
MEKEQTDNKYLLLDFWEFAIISTLVVVFFPWSLLFSVVVYGLDSTKLLIFALLHDAIKTLFAIISVVISIGVIIAVLVWLFG